MSAYNSRNIFADKASIVIRKMLSNPGKKWVIRDFTGENEISIGMVQRVFEIMTKKGYLDRIKRGPHSYGLLANSSELVNEWIRTYSFEQNYEETYYTPDKKILNKFKIFLKDKTYALTLHSGANLMTSYVVTDHIHLYYWANDWNAEILDIRQRLDLKELVNGGNIHILRPYYKKSVFYNTQSINGCKVVSNLQLFLDLYNYQPRGREHAEYLKNTLIEKGGSLYE